MSQVRNKPRIGILIGSHLPPNEENVLLSLGKMMKDKFNLNLVINETSCAVPHYLHQYYSVYGYSNRALCSNKPPILEELITSFYILRRYVEQTSPDILFHLTKPQTYGFCVALTSKTLKIPFVIRLAGNVLRIHTQTEGLLRWHNFLRVYCFAIIAFRLAPRIITIGENLTHELIHTGINPRKVWTIPQPIDTDRFYPATHLDRQRYREALSIDSNTKVILFVGRMSKLESVDIMPRIIKQVLAANRNFIFMFVGSPSSYAQRLKAAGGDSVRIVGEILHQEIARFYRAADLLIHISGGEGCIPNTVLEASACELPICANRVGAIESVTKNVFDKAEEFITFILSEQWEPIPIPSQFRWSSLRHRYIKCFETI